MSSWRVSLQAAGTSAAAYAWTVTPARYEYCIVFCAFVCFFVLRVASASRQHTNPRITNLPPEKCSLQSAWANYDFLTNNVGIDPPLPKNIILQYVKCTFSAAFCLILCLGRRRAATTLDSWGFPPSSSYRTVKRPLETAITVPTRHSARSPGSWEARSGAWPRLSTYTCWRAPREVESVKCFWRYCAPWGATTLCRVAVQVKFPPHRGRNL